VRVTVSDEIAHLHRYRRPGRAHRTGHLDPSTEIVACLRGHRALRSLRSPRASCQAQDLPSGVRLSAFPLSLPEALGVNRALRGPSRAPAAGVVGIRCAPALTATAVLDASGLNFSRSSAGSSHAGSGCRDRDDRARRPSPRSPPSTDSLVASSRPRRPEPQRGSNPPVVRPDPAAKGRGAIG
jgi:hypothetical protein